MFSACRSVEKLCESLHNVVAAQKTAHFTRDDGLTPFPRDLSPLRYPPIPPDGEGSLYTGTPSGAMLRNERQPRIHKSDIRALIRALP